MSRARGTQHRHRRAIGGRTTPRLPLFVIHEAECAICGDDIMRVSVPGMDTPPAYGPWICTDCSPTWSVEDWSTWSDDDWTER